VLVEVNEALCRLLGRGRDDVLGHALSDFVGTDDPDDAVAPGSGLADADDSALRVARQYERPDGERRWASLAASLIEGDDGRPWTVAYLQDTTARRRREDALLDFEANLAAVAGVVRQIQSGGDARQIIVQAAVVLAQGQHATLFEPAEDGLTLRATATTDEAFRDVSIALSRPGLSAQVFTSGRTVLLPRAAEDHRARPDLVARSGCTSIAALPVRSAAGVAGVLVVGWEEELADLGARRSSVLSMLADQAGIALRQIAMLAELEDLALTDALTGIPNRRSWEQLLGFLIAGARRSNRPLTVALADLDHFKLFNDSHGHRAGDTLLGEFAVNAQRRLREGDVIARWGGEEFALALPECAAAHAPQILERVRRAVPSSQTCSIGYAEWDGRENAASLMERIDRALYRAKAAGRDQIAPAEAD
jgi:diguanylate cyclase (GGDEF)-like protein/PAS domain S-box-containing protein